MTPPDKPTDPVLARAFERARLRFEACRDKWKPADEEGQDAAEEAVGHARTALEHLDRGQWDEADAAATLALELDEEFGSGEVWRDFALLIEEAAAIGRAG